MKSLPKSYKAAAAGGIFGILLTLGAIAQFKMSTHSGYADFSMVLLWLALEPAAIVCRLLGITLQLATDNGSGGSSDTLAVASVCCITIINALIFASFGFLTTLIFNRKTGKRG